MHASRTMSAATAARMALRTKAAGPNLRTFSKSNAISKSKAHFTAAVIPLLIASKTVYVLGFSYSKAHTAAVRVRGKTTDLIYLRVVFCSGSEENVAAKLSAFEALNR